MFSFYNIVKKTINNKWLPKLYFLSMYKYWKKIFVVISRIRIRKITTNIFFHKFDSVLLDLNRNILTGLQRTSKHYIFNKVT